MIGNVAFCVDIVFNFFTPYRESTLLGGGSAAGGTEGSGQAHSSHGRAEVELQNSASSAAHAGGVVAEAAAVDFRVVP